MNKVIEILNNSKTVALFAHINPDPDAYGCLCALQRALMQMGKNCTVFLNEKPEKTFDFLNFGDVKFEIDGEYDLFVALDTSSVRRLGIFGEWFLKQENTLVIDHHMTREDFAKYAYVDFKKSSNCEILFELLKQMNVNFEKDILNALYCGIAGDTGGFMHSNTTKLTHDFAGELIEKGADFALINKKIFSTVAFNELKLLAHFINKIEVYDNVGVGVLTEKDKKKFGLEKNFDTSMFINTIQSIDGVEVSLLIKQVKGKNYNISLRSTPKYNVAKFAEKYGGGGHFCAAGGIIVGNLQTVKKVLTEDLIDYVKNYKD